MTIRYGQPMQIGDVRQSLRDFATSLLFNGDNSYVSLGTENPFTSISDEDPFFISMWVKWFGVNGEFQHLLAKRDSYGASTMNFDLYLKNTNGAIGMDTGAAATDTGFILPTGVWRHICWTHNGRDRLYVDCQLEADVSDRVLGTGTGAELVIGAVDTPKSESFNGLIDEVVIGLGNPTWKDVIAMKSKFKYTSDNASEGTYYPWLYLKFDEGSGKTALDSSGNSRDGTISGAAYSSDVALKART